MRAAVVDASVAAKWVVEEEHSDRAVLLLDYDALHAPAHWRAEAVNVLWSKVFRGKLARDVAEQKLDVLMRPLIIETDIAELMIQAFEIAADASVTVYDALYVALAMERRLTLVTADQRLLRRLQGRSDLQVQWVGSLTA